MRVSSKWKDVIFHKLRAEGGFEISARRQNGETSWIHIKSLAGEPCIIEPGFTDPFRVKGGKAKQIKDGLYSINGAMVHPFVQTPNADKLIQQGIRFSNSYIAAPVSAPSRV